MLVLHRLIEGNQAPVLIAISNLKGTSMQGSNPKAARHEPAREITDPLWSECILEQAVAEKWCVTNYTAGLACIEHPSYAQNVHAEYVGNGPSNQARDTY